MPTLGFLKKKRTKESPGQLQSVTSPTTSQPTSPVTPTSSRGFHNSIASISTQSSVPYQPQDSSQRPQSRSNDQPTNVGEHGPMTHGITQQQQTYATSPNVAHAQKPAEHQSQNLPSISNLIHPQQHDGAGQSYPTPQASSQPATSNQIDAAARQPQQQQIQQQPQVRQTKGKYSLTDFEILRTLGTGSFGRVHLVQSKHNQRFYAVKVLKKAQVHKMKQVEHTNDERKMLQEVKHPFLITLWGTFQDSRNLYMVMDFVEGGELFSLLRKSQFYAAEVTLALEYLHARHIIYRDLKPENLLLDRHGHLKITDFGFAKKVPDITWTLCGTPDYLAPEVVSSKGYNKSVDW
ncbi:cAMP-dependent protein kinase catalytic subunit [Clarireedia jacksonii]